MPVSTIQAPISDTPFINPSPDPGATGPVRPPGQDLEVSPAVKKHKGKSKQKKAIKPASSSGSSDQIATDPIPPPKTVVPGPGLQALEKPEETVFSFTSVTSLGSASQQVIRVLLPLLRTVLFSRIRLCQMGNPFRTGQIKTLVRRVNFQILRLLRETKK